MAKLSLKAMAREAIHAVAEVFMLPFFEIIGDIGMQMKEVAKERGGKK